MRFRRASNSRTKRRKSCNTSSGGFGWSTTIESGLRAECTPIRICPRTSSEIQRDQLTVHADRGTSMTSKTLALKLADLGVVKSHSRPHVSDDNPYSEAQFRTLKYRPDYPDRFGCIEDARSFCADFFDWYNHEHHHSGIAMVTPYALHSGRAGMVLERRAVTMASAYAQHPERFVRGAPQSAALPTAVWINKPKATLEPANKPLLAGVIAASRETNVGSRGDEGAERSELALEATGGSRHPAMAQEVIQ
jgi:hypothetical protein